MKMGRASLSVVFSAFLFIGVVNAQLTPCGMAGQNLAAAGCFAQLTSFGNQSLCNATNPCRMLFDSTLNNCSSTVRPYNYNF